MKKPKLFEIVITLIIIALITLAIIYSGCTKKEMYKCPPEINIVWDKTIQYDGDLKTGSLIKFWITMPPDFDFRKRFHIYTNSSSTHLWGDTVYFTPKKKGYLMVLVDGFPHPDSLQFPLHSYLWRRNINDNH